MRLLRRLSVLLLLVSAALCGAYYYYFEMNKDVTRPVISMEESSVVVSVDATEEELLKGITATDDVDGDVSDSLFVEKLDNFSTEGTRKMTVVAFDSAGNVSKATREISYSDYASPQFQLDEALRFPVGTSDILSSLSAEDVLGADLSERVKVTGRYTMSSTAGDYPMEFSVANDAGDVSYLTATVTLYDTVTEASKPTIGLKEYIVYTRVGQKITARDYLDSLIVQRISYKRSGNFFVPETKLGDYSTLPDTIDVSDVKVSDTVDYNTPGSYEITYEYTYNDYTGTVRLIVVVCD